MYEVFYNFKAEPFRLSPDHKFCYEHKSYAKARAYMAYAFKRAEGFVMITGRPGTGKTTLIGELVESLSKDRVYTANLVCTQLQADDLLKTVAFSFGIGSTGIDKAEMLQRLTVLLHRWHREGRRALLIVDEAQDLSSSAMEELRLLTNIQVGGQPLLQIFLLGQPELRDLILSPAMEQVHQRIVAASHIEGLGVEETEAYVLHRLTVVGWRGDPAIDRAIFPLIHKFSEGVPRRINLICSRLFLLGSVEQRHRIGVEDVRVVITELQAENLAAGTGISQQDFDQVGEPEWVPAPQSEQQAPTAQRLHVVDNEQFVAVDEKSSDNPMEAKKKDTSGLTLPIPPVPEDHVADPGDSSVYFEDEPEYDQGIEAATSNDYISAGSNWAASGVADRNYVPGPVGAGRSPASWRRPVLLGFITVALLSLIIWTAYLSYRGQGSSEREYVTGAGVDQIAAAHPTSPDYPASREMGEREATLSSERSVDVPEVVPKSSSVDDEPETPPMTPVASSGSDASLVSEGEAVPSQDEVVPTNISSPEDSEEADAESTTPVTDSESSAPVADLDSTAPAADSESTISINFSFDSDDLIPDSHLALEKAVMMLRENPDSIAAITGFTDKQGNEEYNLVLSRKRADAVKQYLVDAGIAQERLRVEGRGALIALDVEPASDEEDAMEPFRVVQIKLSSDHSR